MFDLYYFYCGSPSSYYWNYKNIFSLVWISTSDKAEYEVRILLSYIWKFEQYVPENTQTKALIAHLFFHKHSGTSHPILGCSSLYPGLP